MTTRREEIEMLAGLMTEPGRSLARREVEEIEAGRLGSRVADLVRSRKAPQKLAVLLALEASEWRLAGSVKTSTPKTWMSWFSVEVFPDRRLACARVERDQGPDGRYLLSWAVAGLEAGAAVPKAIREAVSVLRDELAERLGSSVRVYEVG